MWNLIMWRPDTIVQQKCGKNFDQRKGDVALGNKKKYTPSGLKYKKRFFLGSLSS